MSEFFDETLEEQESREKFEYFFGQYSAEIRKNLLAKNIKKPDNLYDILYTKVRRDLLAKNEQTFNITVDDIAKDVRNNMISKHVEHQIDLEKSSDAYRQNQLSKNKLLDSTVSLNNMTDSIRGKLLSSNVQKDINLDENANVIREKNLSNNVDKNINLDQTANEVRGKLISKNKSDSKVDLDSIADSKRNSLLSSNVENIQNIDKTSEHYRNSSLNKNKEKEFDIDKTSEQYRDLQSSKNVDSKSNVDDVANLMRGKLISKNEEAKSNIDDIAQKARAKNESSNIDSNKNIDKIADSSRATMVSGNIDNPINLDKTANSERSHQESKNNDKQINLDATAEKVRTNMLSSNKEENVDLNKTADIARNLMLSSNKSENTNVDNTGDIARKNLLSANKPVDINLDKTSQIPRDKALSSNVSKNIDLDKGSQIPRDAELSSNVSKNIDLDKDSEKPRHNLLASNVSKNIDLDKSSDDPRKNLLAHNVSKNIDLDKSSDDPRKNSLAHNVSKNIDLDKNSEKPRHDLLASNVHKNIDLDADSSTPRNTELSSNVPKNIDLDKDSEGPRKNLLNHNVKNNIDLDVNSASARNKLLANNVPNYANLEYNGALTRNTLLHANVGSPNPTESIADVFRHYMLTKNNHSTGLGTNVFLGGTSLFIGVSNLELISTPIRELMKLRGKLLIKNSKLQQTYGLQTFPDGMASAEITRAAQLYNLQKNVFYSVGYNESQSGYLTLLNNHADGFQEMISLTSKLSAFKPTETNTTPASVVSQNSGAYVGRPTNADKSSPVIGLLKPGDENAKLGTAASMMANTVPSDSISNNFNKAERGVVHIINTIKKGSSVMAKNYDSQNNNSFIIGTNPDDGSPKKAYSRYTIANPYQPNTDAGTLEFRIKNYAITNGNSMLVDTMSFPPYIKSFANSDSANWNKIDYLGRPEPIYTYSNSNREGSISFYVLTDYSQKVDIGYDFEKGKVITETFDRHFTDSNNVSNKHNINAIDVEIKSKQSEIQKYNAFIQVSVSLALDESTIGVIPDVAGYQAKIAELNKEISALEITKILTTNDYSSLKGGDSSTKSTRNYKEFDMLEGNVYKALINGGAKKDKYGNIDLQTETTAQRLTRMKKNLLFQPAFFSGDKVDFLTRMEFIAKLTRPARNSSDRGFSFTYPPVCQLTLGSWFNHSVIINSVSYDYADAPWTNPSGDPDNRVQPMWCLVNISFNIVGQYGGNTIPGNTTPLANDRGGFFQPNF